ncbi:MAG TPA: hypothetical protein VGO97_04180 [Solirubrobacterales bacterium]|jgi:hypothetical protein|nr:hypothetical protein [Solirubrobacterales bacterium]
MGRGAILKRRRRGSSDDGFSTDRGHSTIPPVNDPKNLVAAAFVRRACTAALGIFILLGATSVLGERKTSVHAAARGYTLDVKYSRVSRPGLDTPWQVTVRRDGGFPGPVVLRTTAAYFDLFDENGLDSEPDSVEQDDRWVTMTFDDPSGDTLVIDFDARISPTTQRGKSASTALMDGDTPFLTVNYKTTVMP